jgi:hypothetical protein
MSNICYYISYYGYGHASRAIAIIRALLDKSKRTKIYVRTGYPFGFVKQSLPSQNVRVYKIQNNVGVAFFKKSFKIDKRATESLLNNWVSFSGNYLQKEKVFCKEKKIGLILSDVPPKPLKVAEELGIPGVIISNFTWFFIYNYLFGETANVIDLKKDCSLASLALILPFNEKMAYIKNKKDISLVSRTISVQRSFLKSKLGINPDELLIFCVSKSFDHQTLAKAKIPTNLKIKLLLSSNVDLKINNSVTIPETETETQNYLAACGLVISKAGYSTLAEAITAKVPICLFKREGFREDELMEREINRMGIGTIISSECLINGEWTQELENLSDYKSRYDGIDERYKKDGAEDIFCTIADLMGNRF